MEGTVALKNGKIGDIYSVIKVDGETALCLNKTSSEVTEFLIKDLVSVAQFGDPIFPSLIPN